MKVNKEWLTYEEWLAAANCHRAIPLDNELAHCDWICGVDPTEHADISTHENSPKFGPQSKSEEIIFAEENARVDFQHNLQKLLNEKNISRQHLANKLNYSEEEINNLFSSDANPDLKTIARIFSVLGSELILTFKK